LGTAAQLIASNNARSIEHLEHLALAAEDGKPGVTIRRLVIPRLPYTRQEADRLLALAPKTESLRALDFSAHRATPLSPEPGQCLARWPLALRDLSGFANRPWVWNQVRWPVQQLCLRFVRVHDDSLIDVTRTAWNVGESRCEKSAGARLCGGEQDPAPAAGLKQRRCIGDDPLVDHERVDHQRPIMAGGPWRWP